MVNTAILRLFDIRNIFVTRAECTMMGHARACASSRAEHVPPEFGTKRAHINVKMKVDFYTVWNVVFILFLLCVFLYLLLGYLLFTEYNLFTFHRSLLVQGCGAIHNMNIRQYNTVQYERCCLYSYKNIT